MKIPKKLNPQAVLVFVIIAAIIEFLAVSFISFLALRGMHTNLNRVLFLLIGVNLSMVVLFILIMLLVWGAFKKMNYYAFTSSITGLPNKNYVLHHLVDEIARSGTFSALMSLDMDHFKAVNDRLGHLAGDQLLQYAGRRFRKTLSSEDCVCHVGGDEFLFFIKSIQDKEKIGKLATDLLGTFKTPFHIAGKTVDCVTASLGIALIPKDGCDFQTLYNCADGAMYAAKNAGKNRFFFFDETTHPHGYQNAVRKKESENSIAVAI